MPPNLLMAMSQAWGVVEDVGSRSSDRRFVTVDGSEIPFPTTVWMCRNTLFQ